MKKLFFIFILFFISPAIFAQKVSIEKDVVSVEDVPSFKIISTGNMAQQAFVVQNMDGDQLISFDPAAEKNPNGTGRLDIHFTGMPNTAQCNMTMGFKKMMAKKIVALGVIKNGRLSEDGVARLCAAYEGNAATAVAGSNTVNTANDYTIVVRNTSAPLFIMNGEIKQDYKLVGKYRINDEMISNMPGHIVRFFQPENNTIIAQASYQNFSESCSLLLYKNNRLVSIPLSKNTTDDMKIKEVTSYLIQHGFM
ncbi:hypothetical protein ACTHGU_17590 [Chitinophagaceae bacterium MMS25-I14]